MTQMLRGLGEGIKSWFEGPKTQDLESMKEVEKCYVARPDGDWNAHCWEDYVIKAKNISPNEPSLGKWDKYSQELVRDFFEVTAPKKAVTDSGGQVRKSHWVECRCPPDFKKLTQDQYIEFFKINVPNWEKHQHTSTW